MKKTKIVCTMGPSSLNEAVLEEMLRSGMNVARFNFSHGTHETHREGMELVRRVRQRLNMPVAIMLDTRGPEIRLHQFEGGAAVWETGREVTLVTQEIMGNAESASITYAGLPTQVGPGQKLLIDDGRICLEVLDVTDGSIRCVVRNGGTVRNRKSINVPGVHLDMPYLSEQDKADLRFGVENDVDFVAASFTRTADDVVMLRKFLDYYGGHDIRIIAKIENMEGIENFDAILEKANGIMVARGDMGVEVAFEKLPGLQKSFIRRCYQAGKVVITATQMLESMIANPSPTRAEITDVANAVFDGTSAVMLSGESAMGQYPAQAVEVMARVAEQAEQDAFRMDAFRDIRYDMDASDITNAICHATCTTARDINAQAIIAVTKGGRTARRMSKFRPYQPIVAATPEEKTYYQLALSWGVYPVMARYQRSSDELFQHAVDCAKQDDLVHDGDRVVITAGTPLGTTGNTNTLRVQIAGERF